MKQSKKVKSLVFEMLDNIVLSSKRIAKEWDRNTIPLITLKEMLSNAYLTLDDNALKNFETNFNKTIDVFYDTCENKAESMDSKSIPVSFIEICINKIKESMAINSTL